jgi:hypothetical protein
MKQYAVLKATAPEITAESSILTHQEISNARSLGRRHIDTEPAQLGLSMPELGTW